MSTVFVHGVPETSLVWGPIIDALGLEDPITLQLPGFGCDRLDGFDSTMDEYADWLVAQLNAINGPIHLVTHDWGALLGLRVLAEHPQLAASWVTDMGNLTDDFEWHDTARIWQTPGDGEAFMEGITGASPADRGALLMSLGIGEAVAMPMGAQVDATMSDSILRLYRSATEIGPAWGPGIDKITVPTLVVEATLDAYRREGATAELAERIGCETVRLDDAGHWWMTTHADVAAAALNTFCASLS